MKNSKLLFLQFLLSNNISDSFEKIDELVRIEVDYYERY